MNVLSQTIIKYSRLEAGIRPVNAKSSACKRCKKFVMDKIMKKIMSIELVALNGGAAAYDCMTLLQYEANTHQNSGIKELEDAYWDDWADRFEACAGAA